MAFKNVHRKKNLSHEVASAIRDAVFQGEYPEGSSIPPEPELAEQFGVSRAVIRDATRILEARGLIEIIQGKGMFVTSSAAEAFEEVLLIALKKTRATAADVDKVLRVLLSGACAGAADGENGDIGDIGRLVKAYMKLKEEERDEERLAAARLKVLSAIFTSSGSKVLSLLGPALLRLGGGRIGEDGGEGFIRALSEKTQSDLRGFLAQAAEIRGGE